MSVTEKRKLDPRVPFTSGEATAAGLGRRALAGDRYQRLLHDMYVGADVTVTPRLLARAALKVSPANTHVSHHTAAQLWGGIVPNTAEVHVCSPRRSHRSQRTGIFGHECGEHGPEGMGTDAFGQSLLTRRHGLPVSSPAYTFLQLAGFLGLVDLVVLGDSLVKAGHLRPRQLRETAEQWRGRGAKRARRAAAFVREGADSPMETRLRMLLVLAGLPEPVVNHVVRDEDGVPLRRFDLCYPGIRLIIEYDGRQHAEDDAQWDWDIDRREELDRGGWRLLVVRSKGIYREPERTLDRVLTTLRELGAPDVPRCLDQRWKRHFPGRPAGPGARR
ncbi:MAG TPA: DUF559 domain-containing protein [Segeticoccus sp.]|nr:DUF559 domain-containing protein [Segeticoccus sp.]